MRMRNPPHPGLSVRHDRLDPMRPAVAEGAKAPGVTRQAMNNSGSRKAGISAAMSSHLEKSFGGRAEPCLRVQTAYDLSRWNHSLER
ncbi:HigA family addiction module antitoxin [Nitrospira sp. NS4]|uniref:HigA family addiction module antitoxin n=1 Tax=Nitrospira sp. NS4 TaxID=3414498 RepID=UPI003C2E6F4D